MSDWRYHVATLSAVLLSLAIGLMIGALYLSPKIPPAFEQSLRNLDNQLSQRNEELRRKEADLETLRHALDRSQTLYERLIERVPTNFLRGYRVALVQTGDESDLAEEVKRSLEEAGAEVLSITTLQWREVKPEEVAVVVNNLSRLLAQGGDNPAKEVLRRRAGVRLQGDFNFSCRYVLLISGFQGQPEEEKLPDSVLAGERALIEAIRDKELKLYACEPFDCQFSLADLYRSYRLPHVDCADLPLGRLILPFLLLEERGSYGLKSTADAVLPERVREWVK